MSSAVREASRISPEEYLESELISPIRHEYVGGTVHAMIGGSLTHNLISGNIFATLREHLRGHRCQAYVNDVKVRIGLEDLFYYPDVVIACDHSGESQYVLEHQAIIFEVLSPGTEQIDRREKLLFYKIIPSLETYVLIEQESIGVTVFERGAQWHPRVLSGKEDTLRLDAIGSELKVERFCDIRDQCIANGTAFFFKQWGGVFKKMTGRVLEGRTWDELPCVEQQLAA